MIENVAKNPAEPKYRKVRLIERTRRVGLGSLRLPQPSPQPNPNQVRLSNAKVAEGLVHVPGVRPFMGAIGWQLVEDEFLQLPDTADAAGQLAALEALLQACASAKEAARTADLEARTRGLTALLYTYYTSLHSLH